MNTGKLCSGGKVRLACESKEEEATEDAGKNTRATSTTLNSQPRKVVISLITDDTDELVFDVKYSSLTCIIVSMLVAIPRLAMYSRYTHHTHLQRTHTNL